MDQILRKPNIWDLHIHTPLGTPTKKNYDGITSEEFVDSLIKIYDEATNKIGMISFTDHNRINAEVYKLFREKSDIAVIPGVELDIFLTESDQDSKHIIFYFDEKELSAIDELKLLIEAYIEKHSKVVFEDFVMHLIYHKKKFAVSPHAFKQGKRGIDDEWSYPEITEKGMNRFTGLFFPFWEAGGKSDICKAIDFLEGQNGDDENQQAVIAFSDSADFVKLKKYIENPYQYFLCLNSFKGLLLAGSDLSRIIYSREERPNKNPSEKISSIVVSNNLKPLKKENRVEIEFSDRLNVIVGGRGKGKSALIGAIVSGIDESKVDTKKLSFLKKFNIQINNFNNKKMASDTKIEYLSQSYINLLFESDNQNKLEEFFKKQFSDNNGIISGIANVLSVVEHSETPEITEDINVMDDLKNLIILDSKTTDLEIGKKSSRKISLYKEGEGYKKIIKKLLPKEKEIWDEKLERDLGEFICTLLQNIARVNYQDMLNVQFAQMVKNKIDNQKKKRSEEDKKKVEAKIHIEQKLKHLYGQELERVRQINKLYEVDESMTTMQMQYQQYKGEGENRIFFASASNKEHPVEYARRLIIEAINKNKIKNVARMTNEELFKRYAISRDFERKIKDGIGIATLICKISRLEDLKAHMVHRIVYKNKDGYMDLHKTSPGMQTSVIMEYVLHSDSTTTLLIDQPEDNIDNEARYSQLTKWIKKQKYNRQIILVTHDANIVINGDAECVIIANHSGDKFNYEFGALEYKDILDKAAIILDGGKIAIHRRMDKYGE